MEIIWKIANIQFTTLLNGKRLLKKYSTKVPLQNNTAFFKTKYGKQHRCH